jgi:hypothetical protein
MTTPTEQSIRKACEEAGVDDVDHMLWAISVIPDDTRARLLLALARRIEADAVPVWVEYTSRLEVMETDCLDWKARATAAEAKVAVLREALELADCALRGANMNMDVVERRVRAALQETDNG